MLTRYLIQLMDPKQTRVRKSQRLLPLTITHLTYQNQWIPQQGLKHPIKKNRKLERHVTHPHNSTPESMKKFLTFLILKIGQNDPLFRTPPRHHCVPSLSIRNQNRPSSTVCHHLSLSVIILPPFSSSVNVFQPEYDKIRQQ